MQNAEGPRLLAAGVNYTVVQYLTRTAAGVKRVVCGFEGRPGRGVGLRRGGVGDVAGAVGVSGEMAVGRKGLVLRQFNLFG